MTQTALALKKGLTRMIDVAIVGAGPAGLAAGVYAARAGLSTVLFEALMVGGQLTSIDHLENYPGFAQGVNGFEIAFAMREQAERFGAKIVSEQVVKVQPSVDEQDNPMFVLETVGRSYQAKTVILAMGAKPRQLPIEGIETLVGRGVSYCATCDGSFFKEQAVAVVGGGNSAFDNALLLSERCSHVTLIHRSDRFRAEQILVDRVKQRNNISLLTDMTVSELIQENGQLTGLALKSKIGKDDTLPVCGLFVALGRLPDTQVLVNLAPLDENGYVFTDGKMAIPETPGLFVAGDCRIKSVCQLTTAVSDGTVAAVSACEYLEKHK